MIPEGEAWRLVALVSDAAVPCSPPAHFSFSSIEGPLLSTTLSLLTSLVPKAD